MKKVVGAIALVLAFVPLAHAQETAADKAREAKTDAVQAKRTAGGEFRKAGRAIKATGRKVRQAVVTRCADGRHTVKGVRGCRGHGGVSDPK